MKIEQIYTGCLAQGAYYIQSDNEAVIIDPLREVQPYIEKAKKDGVRIKYVLETHFHADFVSGHLDLSQKTGAKIVYGPTAQPKFEAHIATDGEILSVGKVKIKVLHTPGHTMESACYLLFDENSKETAIFTGDTLFLGDVGRPDLAQKAGSITERDLAGFLYESIMTKIMPLPNDITVYPGHGAGSACGKNMMKETVDTLGHQKESNYALKQKSKADFVEAVTDGLTTPPAYFPMNVAMNKNGYASIDDVMDKGMKALSPDEFEQLAEASGALILDTRDADVFAKGFVPQSINIGVNGQFAPWVGALVADVKQPILLVSEIGKEEEVVTRLARVGFDHVMGYLKDGFESWQNAGKEIDKVNRISATVFNEAIEKGNKKIVDVRKPDEYSVAHVDNAENKPLDFINDWMPNFNPQEHFYVHCAGGYRSMIASSILKARGFHNFSEVEGGYKAIAEVVSCS
jgi:hydroxyacylglutathione hydrolase